MRVIKRGNPNYDKPWVGQEISCWRCKCIFVLDETDKPDFSSDQYRGDYYKIVCPTCEGVVTLSYSACQIVEKKSDILPYDPLMNRESNLGKEQCPHCRRYSISPHSIDDPNGRNFICPYCQQTVLACRDCGGSGCGDYPYPCDTCGGSGISKNW